MASDARITQSQSYWRGQARPFAILDSSINSTMGTFVIQNMEANGPFTITSLVVGNGTPNTTSTSFSAGETKTMTVAGIGPYTVNTIYDLGVNITYNTPNGITGTKQYSTKNLIGKYV